MQIRCLPKSFYKLYYHSSKHITQSEQIEQRKKCLGDWELLKNRGVPDAEIAKITGISRATYYRHKKARKYLRQRKLPDELRKLHGWRTRADIFASYWEEIEPYLVASPGLQAKMMFTHLQNKYPNKFTER